MSDGEPEAFVLVAQGLRDFARGSEAPDAVAAAAMIAEWLAQAGGAIGSR